MVAFLLSLREGIEAALIVSILLGTLRRTEAPRSAARPVWLGVGTALAASLGLAALLGAIGADFEGRGQQIFEGMVVLLAAGVLTWMIFWMQGQGRQIQARLSAEVRRTVAAPAEAVSLFGVAFLAVFREGVELALFLAATVFAAGAGQTVLGAALGLAAAAALGALLFAGTIRLKLGRFFQLTGALLVLFAAGMVAYGAHELVEAGVLPGLIDPLWNMGRLLSETSLLGQLLKALFGYHSEPALSEVLAYAAYFLAVGSVLLYKRAQAVRVAEATAER